MESLRRLRDRVYTRRVDDLRWDLADAFERKGDYTPNSANECHNSGQDSSDEELDEAFMDDAEYLPEEVLAVKRIDAAVPFWVAKVWKILDRDIQGQPRTIPVRCCQARDAECDSFLAKYRIRFIHGRNRRMKSYEDPINVAAVLLKSDEPTNAGSLHATNATHLREVLNQK